MTANYFKIVCTKEKGGIYFSAVPHQWERENKLYWPDDLNNSEREALRSNASSVPSDDWGEYDCIVKFSNIPTFVEALQREKDFSKCVDTDAEESYFQQVAEKRSAKKKRKGSDTTGVIDRNQLFSVLSVTQPNPEERIEPSVTDMLLSNNSKDFVFIANEQPVVGNQVTNDELLNKLEELRADFEKFKTDLKTQMKVEYAKINVTLDKICELLVTQNNNWASTKDISQEKTVESENMLSKFKFPIGSEQEILYLENEIRGNEQFRLELINHLSQIGGRGGEADGVKIGYKLVDTVFKPDLLMNFSWTGVCRKGGKEKKPFQIFDGILDVFFQVLLLADSRHTKAKNCVLFREGVLKHAKKRTQRKRVKHSNDITDTGLDPDATHPNMEATEFLEPDDASGDAGGERNLETE